MSAALAPAAGAAAALGAALLCSRSRRPRVQPPWSGASLAAVVAAWFLAASALSAWVSPAPAAVLAASLAHAGAMLAVSVLVARAAAPRDAAARLAGEAAAGGGAVGWAVAGALVCVAGGVALEGFLSAARGRTVSDAAHPIVRILSDGTSPLLLRGGALGLALVLAPLSEELVFRRFLQSALAARLGSAPAIGATALLFAFAHAAHADFPWTVPPHAWIGFILGVVYDRTGRLAPAALAHAVNNAVALGWALRG